MTTRREVLLCTAAGLVAASGSFANPSAARVGAAADFGHLLRDPARLAALPRRNVGRADVVVLGGGVSGLSAAWRLSQSSLDVRLLDLEDAVGGTSTFGEDGVVPHPWGAHYLPVPNPEARATVRLLRPRETSSLTPTMMSWWMKVGPMPSCGCLRGMKMSWR